MSGARLAEWTTFGLGGACAEWAEAADPAAAVETLEAWHRAGAAWRVMGGGSNLLVADGGVPENVLRMVAGGAVPREVVWDEDGGMVVAAWAGMELDRAVQWAVEGEREGLEEFSGIPGSVGGAVCGNAGAFGRALGEAVEAVEVWEAGRGRRILRGEELAFGYRRSALQGSGAAVLRVFLRLAKGDGARAAERREEILALRREKHPDWRAGARTAGSFFKNPAPAPGESRRRSAGAMLEAVGAKEMREGGAYVFEKHANILMAGGGATAADVRRLAERLADAVEGRFGERLEWEVRWWGSAARG